MATAGQLARAAADLRAIFATGKTRSFEWRESQLKALQEMIACREKEILEALRSDLNKPEYEAYLHEIVAVSSSCNFALKNLRQWMTPEKVKTSMASFPSSATIVPEPLGVVLIISTWNYPFLLLLDPLIGAIAAGNAVVLKPSEVAPATSFVLSTLLREYMDTSAVKVIEGATPQVTALLELKWDKIFFTGSSKVGRVVMAAAAKHLTPVVLELGGKSPVVVDSDIDLEVTARRIISGKWGCNAGQTCISPDYILTTKACASQLVEALSSQLEKFFGEEPLRSNDLASIINSNHFERLAKLLDDDKIAGKVVYGGQLDGANLIAPTVILDAPQDSLIMNEEIFGPLLPIVTVKLNDHLLYICDAPYIVTICSVDSKVNKLEDCISLINAREKPLAAYLFTNNERFKEEFVRGVAAGGMAINETALQFAEHALPFGGVGESGMGSYHGKYSFDAFSHKKPVLQRGFKGDSAARYPPYTPEKLKFLKALMSRNMFRILRAMLGL
ncbi:aldehyde dehydrogenase-like isoform X2 [Andrographis paniculata]|uniref:aldehyde dehydrogenase-like isoform X2 n=1 Tax=Andrographis paniculata TaxID=175694 RepID=UPI0021E728E3|nr:aldehyde dehydrogenase-like isoform X2 [Andrographis paniculata]